MAALKTLAFFALFAVCAQVAHAGLGKWVHEKEGKIKGHFGYSTLTGDEKKEAERLLNYDGENSLQSIRRDLDQFVEKGLTDKKTANVIFDNAFRTKLYAINGQDTATTVAIKSAKEHKLIDDHTADVLRHA